MNLPLDSAAFRRALGHFATGVTTITARDATGNPIGLACNSFSSLSLDPPLVQWSIARTSRNHTAMCATTHFAIHVLDATQRDLCMQFSAKDGDRFANVDLDHGLHNLPVLNHCHARFECERVAAHEAGDHTILIGHVLRLREHEGTPLIFYRGQFSATSG